MEWDLHKLPVCVGLYGNEKETGGSWYGTRRCRLRPGDKFCRLDINWNALLPYDSERPMCGFGGAGLQWGGLPWESHVLLGEEVFVSAAYWTGLFCFVTNNCHQYYRFSTVWLWRISFLFPAVGSHTTYAAVGLNGGSFLWTSQAADGSRPG